MEARSRVMTAAALIYLLSLHHLLAFSFSTSPLTADEYNDLMRDVQFRKDTYDPRPGYRSQNESPDDKSFENNELFDFLRDLIRAYSSSRVANKNLDTGKNSESNIKGKLDNEDSKIDDPTNEELGKIFDEDDSSEKTQKLLMPLQIPLHNKPDAEGRKADVSVVHPKYLDLTGLDNKQAQKILDEVAELKKKGQNKIHTDKDESDEVKDDELSDVFGGEGDDDDDMDGKYEARKRKAKNGEIAIVAPKQDQQSAYSRLFKNQEMKKRSTNGQKSPETRLAQQIDLRKLFDVIAKLRLKERLESREINFLSDSLNDATSSQVRKSLDGLQHEMASIEKAMSVERALEKVDRQLNDADRQYLDLLSEAYVKDAKNGLVGEGGLSKRTRNTPDDTWVDDNIDVSSSPEDGGDDDINDDSLAKYPAENALSKTQRETSNPIKTHELLDAEDDEAVLPLAPPDTGYTLNRDDRRTEPSESDIDKVRELLDRLEQDKDTSEGESTDYRSCPEIETLSDNCDLADDMGVDVDEEARDLCSRHQACYACGWTLQKTSTQCDEAYISEAQRMCGGDDLCMERADTFLRLERRQHRVGSRFYSACLSRCVVDYIYGVDSKK